MRILEDLCCSRANTAGQAGCIEAVLIAAQAACWALVLGQCSHGPDFGVARFRHSNNCAPWQSHAKKSYCRGLNNYQGYGPVSSTYLQYRIPDTPSHDIGNDLRPMYQVRSDAWSWAVILPSSCQTPLSLSIHLYGRVRFKSTGYITRPGLTAVTYSITKGMYHMARFATALPFPCWYQRIERSPGPQSKSVWTWKFELWNQRAPYSARFIPVA